VPREQPLHPCGSIFVVIVVFAIVLFELLQTPSGRRQNFVIVSPAGG
jgi:hypothetical protein